MSQGSIGARISVVLGITLPTIGCVGTIDSVEGDSQSKVVNDDSRRGDDQTNPSTTTPDPNRFACGTDSAVQTGMRRLAKVQYVNSVREFLSTLSATDQDNLLAGVQTALTRIPDD